MATDSMYLENLDQWIVDDNKIVTYRWLSNTLRVPVDVAKQMLYHYGTQRNKNVEILYLVAGSHEDKHIVKLVPAGRLNETKKWLTQVTSIHIYSLQQKIPLDSATIFSVDHDSILAMEQENPYTNPYVTNKWSSIDSKEAEVTGKSHEEEERALLKTRKELQKQKQEEEEAMRKEREQRKQTEAANQRTNPKKPTTKGKSTSKNSKAVAPQRGTLTNFFTTGLPQPQPQGQQTNDTNGLSKPKPPPKGNNFENFFTKSKPAETEKAEDTEERKKEQIGKMPLVNKLDLPKEDSSDSDIIPTKMMPEEEFSSLSEDDLVFEESKKTVHTRLRKKSDIMEKLQSEKQSSDEDLSEEAQKSKLKKEIQKPKKEEIEVEEEEEMETEESILTLPKLLQSGDSDFITQRPKRGNSYQRKNKTGKNKKNHKKKTVG